MRTLIRLSLVMLTLIFALSHGHSFAQEDSEQTVEEILKSKYSISLSDYQTVYPDSDRWRSDDDPEVALAIGVAYLTGVRARQNFGDAYKYFRRAAMGRHYHASSQFHLGIMYHNGFGVNQDAKQAFRWYGMAAQQGLASAQLEIAKLYESGQAGTQNQGAAAKWYKLAADQGFVAPLERLGFLYLDGRGVEQDDAQAFQWFLKSAEQGVLSSQRIIGLFYVSGRGVSRDDYKSLMWLSIAEAQGDEIAAKAFEDFTAGLTQEQLAEVDRRASNCLENKYKNCG